MIWSKYNYMFHSDKHGKLLYNSLSNSFCSLSESFYNKLKVLKDTNDFSGIDNDIIKQLKESKIIVENDLDELYNLKLGFLISRFDKTVLNITIAPTLDCNFKCFYCYEGTSKPIYMTDKTETNLITFINSYNESEYVHFHWIGGEPLLAFDRMLSITKKTKALGKKIKCGIITNGYLMNESVIDSFEFLGLNFIQITIDGLKNTHNNRRIHITNNDSFETIITNIDLLYKKDLTKYLCIRINIDKENIDEYNFIFAFLKDRYGKGINIQYAFVHDKAVCNSISDCHIDRAGKAKFILDNYNNNGNTEFQFYPLKIRTGCSVRSINSFVIGADGEIYKCWHDIGDENSIIGNINRKGLSNNTLLTRYLVAADPFEDKQCRNCFYLPVCGGGCPFDRIKNEFKNESVDCCLVTKGYLKQFLEIHYQQIQDEK